MTRVTKGSLIKSKMNPRVFLNKIGNYNENTYLRSFLESLGGRGSKGSIFGGSVEAVG